MKYFFILSLTFLVLTAGLYAETEVFFKSNFSRGDVVTVLILDDGEQYTLELKDVDNNYVTGGIFFPLNSDSFKGQAALIGLDSTLSAGKYILLIKNNDGEIEVKGEILIHENVFKKENIPLNYANTSLRTDTNPEIVREAVQIHEIYKTIRSFPVSEIESIKFPFENGIITSWYGDRRVFEYSDGTISRSIHTGTDIAAPFGTRITAGSKGQVVLAGNRIMTGNSVVIEYLPGVYGVFFHMNELFVSTGETVQENTIIGTLGSSGLATGPHLHWELRVGGIPVDPNFLTGSGLIDNSLILSIVSSHTAE